MRGESWSISGRLMGTGMAGTIELLLLEDDENECLEAELEEE